MGDRCGMSISADSSSDETLNRGPLALRSRRQYEFPFGINIVQFSFFPIFISVHVKLLSQISLILPFHYLLNKTKINYQGHCSQKISSGSFLAFHWLTPTARDLSEDSDWLIPSRCQSWRSHWFPETSWPPKLAFDWLRTLNAREAVGKMTLTGKEGLVEL